jgi:hypothetical protein
MLQRQLALYRLSRGLLLHYQFSRRGVRARLIAASWYEPAAHLSKRRQTSQAGGSRAQSKRISACCCSLLGECRANNERSTKKGVGRTGERLSLHR